MDHSMHHSEMHMGHDHDGGMDMGGQCSMNMVFTWSSKNLCIIFRQWRITGPLSLLLSLIAIVLLTAGYEGVRKITRQYELAHMQRLKAYSSTVATTEDEVADESATAGLPTTVFGPSHSRTVHDASSPLLVGRDSRRAEEQRGRIVMAALYAVQVFYSFFIMLLFMTYNGSVMLAVAVGAFVGYLAFGDGTSATKSVACH